MRFGLWAVGVGTLLAVTGSGFAALPAEIVIDSGRLTGTTGESPEVRVYKGIPYAAPRREFLCRHELRDSRPSFP